MFLFIFLLGIFILTTAYIIEKNSPCCMAKAANIKCQCASELDYY